MPTPDDIQFKDLVLANKLATEKQMEKCLQALQAYEDAGIINPLSSVALDKGYLTIKQVNAIRQLQGKSDEYKIRGYTILSTLGQGGLGTVYKARQDSIGRIVALKVMFPNLASNQDYVKRFMLEARVSAQLDHPNIVRGIDFGESEGCYFFAMEFVEGFSVKEVLEQNGAMPEQKAAQIILGVAEALNYAEHHNLVHRDIKPDNIMLTSDGTPKLCDLGLAKATDTDMSLTRTGIVMGTPHYISPEQAVGQKDLDIRSDIYALGVTFYHMITGEVPYQGDTVVSIISQHLSPQIPNPKDKNPAFSDAICGIITTMMAKVRGERYQTSQELIIDLKRFLRGDNPLALTDTRQTIAIDKKQYLEDERAEDQASQQMKQFLDAATLNISEQEMSGNFAKHHPEAIPSNIDAISADTNSIDSSLEKTNFLSYAPAPPQNQAFSQENPENSHKLVAHLERQLQDTKRQNIRLFKVILFSAITCVGLIVALSAYLYQDELKNWWKTTTPSSSSYVPKIYDFGPVYQIGQDKKQALSQFQKQLKKISTVSIDPAQLTRQMVLIPDGFYTPRDQQGKKRAKITMSGFWMDKYEVSNQNYRQFCQQTHHPFPEEWIKRGWNKSIPAKSANLPITNVSFYDASLYARWAGKRLPTEMEWEYAASTPDNKIYPWGNQFSSRRANIGTGKVSSIDSYAAGKSNTGLFNMVGNVWEWTTTTYGDDRENNIIKGGSFSSPAVDIKYWQFDALYPYGKRIDVGFRCVLSKPKKK